jgi:phosphate-selective porin
VRAPLALLFAVVAAAAAAEEPKPATPSKPPAEGWKREGFELSNPSADFKIRLSGYLQADFRSYLDWQVGDGTDDTLRYDESEWRRLRIGIEGEWHRLSFEFDVDPAFDEGDELKNAYLGIRLSREVQLRGGHMKLPVSPEFLTSASKTDFVERAALVTSLGLGRDWGGLVEGELGKVLEYSAGVFEGDMRTSQNRAETTAVGRLVLKPSSWLDLGGSYSQGDVVAEPETPGFDTSPKGLDGTSGTGYRFFPSVYVNGRRQRWGADARLQGGPVALWGEFLEAREERKGQGPTLEDLPDVRGRGWSVTGTWLVTGERKTRTIRPRRGLFEGAGAVELAARYEELWFDDVSNQGFEAAGSRARNIRPAGLKTVTGSVSWWPTRFLRFQGNVLVERYDDALRAPEPGKQGNYVSLVGRAQVHLP